MESEEEEGGRLCYKQRAEKASAGEITLMEWSPTMDVIALAFADFSIALYRLSWQRVWSVEPSTTTVKCFSWRPDGRVLASGHGDGHVMLYGVENGDLLHEIILGTVSTCSMIWREYETKEDQKKSYRDESSYFLSGLPSIENNDVNSIGNDNSMYPEDRKHVKTLSNFLNTLIIGDETGNIHFCISGIFHATTIHVLPKESSHVIHMCMSPEFDYLAILVQSDESLHFYKVDISIMANKSNEFCYIALKYSQISSTVQYINETIQAMTEAWEDILLKIDRKITKYSKDLPTGLTVTDELLILLACGKARPELQSLLLDELTASGVKKLGLSLEISYNSIRRFLINHISRATQDLNFHLHEILGVARWEDVFGALGLSSDCIQDAIQVLGSFALKTQELLFVIDESLRNLKVFFLWLYTIILKLSGEPVPAIIRENFTAEELGMIMEFLRSRFKNVSSSDEQEQTFSLERVGQYFTEEDLKIIEEHPTTSWEKILADSNLTRENVPWLLKPAPNKSLRQLFELLQTHINSCFKTPQIPLMEQLSLTLSIELTNRIETSEDTSFSSCSGVFHKDDSYIIYFPNHQDITVVIINSNSLTQCGCFFISNITAGLPITKEDEGTPLRIQIIKLSYYNSDALSILFAYSISKRTDSQSTIEEKQTCSYAVAQLPISALLSLDMETVDSLENLSENFKFFPRTDVGPFLNQVLHLNKFKPKTAAFSGPRRLAAVLSTAGKRVRLYDVDFDEEEEEEQEEATTEEEEEEDQEKAMTTEEEDL